MKNKTRSNEWPVRIKFPLVTENINFHAPFQFNKTKESTFLGYQIGIDMNFYSLNGTSQKAWLLTTKYQVTGGHRWQKNRLNIGSRDRTPFGWPRHLFIKRRLHFQISFTRSTMTLRIGEQRSLSFVYFGYLLLKGASQGIFQGSVIELRYNSVF